MRSCHLVQVQALGNLLVALLQLSDSRSLQTEISDISEIHPTVWWLVGGG